MENPFAPYELQFSNTERKELIGNVLKALRENKKLQQKELCKILKISTQTYNNYEKGRYEPPIELLVRLAFFYKVSMDTVTQKNRFFKTAIEAQEKMAEYKQQMDMMIEELGDDKDSEALIQFVESMKKLSEQLPKINIEESENKEE